MLCKDNSYGKKEVYITARDKSSDIKKPMADKPQPDPGSVILGSGKTAAGLAELGGGIAAAVPGLSIAASGVVACASVAGCVATVPTVAYGLAIASPGIAAMTKGGFDTLEGIGDIYSGFTGKTSPFDNPLDFGAIPDPW
jgi:hypothetical protein